MLLCSNELYVVLAGIAAQIRQALGKYAVTLIAEARLQATDDLGHTCGFL